MWKKHSFLRSKHIQYPVRFAVRGFVGENWCPTKNYYDEKSKNFIGFVNPPRYLLPDFGIDFLIMEKITEQRRKLIRKFLYESRELQAMLDNKQISKIKIFDKVVRIESMKTAMKLHILLGIES